MHPVLAYTDRIVKLDPPARDELLQAFVRQEFPKGTCLLRAGQVSQHYHFIEQGLVKSSFYKEDKEFIMTFFKETILFTEINSYLTSAPSKYQLLALEPTTVYSIARPDIERLCHRHHAVETLFRQLLAFASVGMMKRISEMLEENATTRYQLFVQEKAPLLQRISLGDLAAYLGITQVSLSRIRAGR
ncbi:cAMP-binding domain of CRP or a regulatory subunit of cAMP-dependent protein kinases [Hymenobacter daecheongensis DSM 21074]|uniref:cAMP-binding domain of CRP or a regulatory subunit of cAMP-dependent protein kinases n=1 Tax=Hymenobacter daecheongensis DSM 21074 TaxID=1121955 RepID=A0A1M6A0T8_9BACT|nr:Crp/Fnr family transcriptional regulator [Hymenobacter daecheongensis]SHI30016.1 cAMP-binding domain of CRP or a regulatory subunit of cAMP-dependent protein kinases [Hymenobacter daecheongensis DSM 21074]